MMHYEKSRRNRSWIKTGGVWEVAKMVEWGSWLLPDWLQLGDCKRGAGSHSHSPEGMKDLGSTHPFMNMRNSEGAFYVPRRTLGTL